METIMLSSRRSTALFVVAFAVIIAGSLVVGCARSERNGTDTASLVDSPVVTDDISVDAMGMDEKRSLAPGFPFQVPVIAGVVRDSEGQPNAGGQGLWTYTVVTPLGTEQVVAWYERSYTVADWELVERREAAAGGELLVFTKGAGAESLIRILGTSEGTVVEAAVGIGVPVATY